jgi:UDP-N-acetyl-D-mannosaminuronic acid transferase (WecB/TagA/CpsF family)/8-oxo-dGTP pyrophosphatase MutT (NUDIX family)
MPELFGVRLPQTNKFQLRHQIRNLKPDRKHVLYFFYSEFLLRANRNPWYKATLNRAQITAIDGKGLHWSMYRIMKPGFLPRIYSEYLLNWPVFLRLPLFLFFFLLECIITLIHGFLTLTTKFNFTRVTKNQVVLGRDFVYDLLKIAQERGWKTLILGGSSTSDEVTRHLIHKLFPDLHLILWTRDSKSLLMRDQSVGELVGSTLNSHNVCQHFPDLWEAKQFIKKEKPDLILTCLGGASGKQEFFIDNLLLDPEIKFTLATGLGAAVDHLGGGARQTVAPNWMINSGLEWLHRFINQPYRRLRIVDSIVTLWWWTVVQEFMLQAEERLTVVNIVQNQQKQFLLVKRKNWLPGDIDWTFVQGGVGKNEIIEEAGVREIVEEAKLDQTNLQILAKAVPSEVELYPISFFRYLFLSAKYNAARKYISFVGYNGTDLPQVNWENQAASWIDRDKVVNYLSVEKQKDWHLALKTFLSS